MHFPFSQAEVVDDVQWWQLAGVATSQVTTARFVGAAAAAAAQCPRK
jgi:hypothetical protein